MSSKLKSPVLEIGTPGSVGWGLPLGGSYTRRAANQSDIVGIGVGLYGGADGGYGLAQRLYVIRGYLPDGLGVTYDYQSTVPGRTYSLDDDLNFMNY